MDHHMPYNSALFAICDIFLGESGQPGLPGSPGRVGKLFCFCWQIH